MMLERYQRQQILPEVGPEGQRRLAQARVLCVGAGGLGCGALPYLAGAGVGHISILDDDVVETSNLQRQVLFRDADQDRPKAECAAERLRALNPEIQVTARVERLHAGNAQSLFEDHDVVIEGSDNFATKFLAGDASVKFGVPLVYGSAVGFEAQVTVFDPDQGPCLRCLYPAAPEGWVPNCAENGVLGPLVGAAGTVQAIETIKLIVSEGGDERLESLIGQLWLLDARDMQTRRLAIQQKSDCPACGRNPASIVLPKTQSASIQSIGPQEALTLSEAVFVDVRADDEWAHGHIPGAIHWPLSRLLAGELPAHAAGSPCIVYCTQGSRAEIAAQVLAETGHAQVRNLRGGLANWPGPLAGGSPD